MTILGETKNHEQSTLLSCSWRMSTFLGPQRRSGQHTTASTTDLLSTHWPSPVSFSPWYHCGIILHLSQATSSYFSLPTQSFLPTASPQPTPYHNAGRWAEVQLNDKPILPGQEGDPGGWYKEEGPGHHRLIWLPPRRQDTEDFQLLLRLKLMMERRGKSQGSRPFLSRT